MLNPIVSRRTNLLALTVLLLLALAASIACATAIMRVQRQALIPGVPHKVIDIPQARLAALRTTKQRADMNVLKNTYFVRNNVPHIRLGIDEYQLLPLTKMEYTPSQPQLQTSQRLTGSLVQFRPWIFAEPVGLPTPIPDVVDHRSSQTPIKDQGGRLTCVCFASMAGLEAAYGGTVIDLSENYANYLYMKAEARVCKDAGLQTHMSADHLSDHGVCRETVCPYQYSFPPFCNNGANPPPDRRADAAADSPYKIKSYQKIWRKDDLTTDSGAWINNPRYLEAILRSDKDIVFGTHVAGWSGNCTGVLDVKLGPDGDPLPSVGGHAMLIVGYNRPQEYFIVKNSWGTDKGQAGYFYLSYDYIRTYAKYGYIINQVEPLPVTMLKPTLKAIPMPRPSD